MNIKNKKNLLIILASIIIVAVIIIIILIKTNAGKNDTVSSATESTSISETVNQDTNSDLMETVTDENGQVITQVSPDSAGDSSASSDNAGNSSSGKSSGNNKSEGGGVNEMDDIFTDKAIENTTTKKNGQKTTDKNGNIAETESSNAGSGDGWSDLY